MLKRIVSKVPGAARVARAMGLAPRDERAIVLDLLPKGGVGAEIGVHKGDFSEALLRTVAPKKLHLVDPWKHEDAPEYKDAWYGGQAQGGQGEMDARYEGVRKRFETQVASGQVQIWRAFSDEFLEKLADAELDWIYIDGNHLYEYVKKDLALSLRKVRVGGLVTGDDYSEGNWWQGGVKRAVDELMAEGSTRRVAIENGQFVLEVLAR